MTRFVVALIRCAIAVSPLPLFADPWPIAAAPPAATSFSISGPSVAARDDGFAAAWPIDTFVGSRIDGITTDRAGLRTSNTAHVLVKDAVTSRLLHTVRGPVLSYEDSRRVRHFARINPDGGAEVEGFPTFTNSPLVYASADGQRILVVRFEIGRISGVMLDENLVLVAGDIVIARDSIELFGVHPSGSGFLVFRRSATGLTVSHIGPDGSIDDVGAIATTTSGGGSAAASDGTRDLLFWSVNAQDGEPTLAGAVITGNVIEKQFLVRSSADVRISPRRLFWTGSSFVLIAQTGRSENEFIAALRFDRDGNQIDPDPVHLTDQPFHDLFSDAAYSDGVVQVGAWEPPTLMGAHGVVFTFQVDGAISNIHKEVVSVLPARQNAPVAASDGTSSLITWREGGADGQRVQVSLIANGRASNPLTLMAVDGITGEPAAAFGGGVYLIVWEFFHHLLGARVTAGGVLLDPSPLVIAAADNANFGTPAVAWNGERFLVAWSGYPLRGAFVTLSGAASEAFDLTTVNFGGSEPALAYNGRRFVLAFTVTTTTSFPALPFPTRIDVIDLRRDATALAAEPVTVIDDGSRSSIATSGNEFLVIAERQSGSLAGAWVDESAQRHGDELSLGPATPTSFGSPSNVAWVGDSYVIAQHALAQGFYQIRAARLAAGGTALYDQRSFASRPDRIGGTSVTIAPSLHDPLIVFTDIRHDNESGGSSRVLIDEFSDLPPWQARRRIVAR